MKLEKVWIQNQLKNQLSLYMKIDENSKKNEITSSNYSSIET